MATIQVAGNNSDGQLGLGNTVNVSEWTEMPLPTELPEFGHGPMHHADLEPLSVSVSKGATNKHVLIIAREKNHEPRGTLVLACGSNSRGQLGLPNTVLGVNTLTLALWPKDGWDYMGDWGPSKVLAGSEFSVIQWTVFLSGIGDNAYGQCTGSDSEIFNDAAIGNAPTNYGHSFLWDAVNATTQVVTPSTGSCAVNDFAVGDHHVMATRMPWDDALATGYPWDYVGCQLYATGRNNRGQLGLGDTTNRNVMTLTANNVLSVACGANHSILTKINSSRWVAETWVCGANDVGQCLLPASADILSWTHVPKLDVRCTLARPTPPVIVAGGNQSTALPPVGSGSGGRSKYKIDVSDTNNGWLGRVKDPGEA